MIQAGKVERRTSTSLENLSVRAGKPAHRKLDVATWEFAPALDRTHIGRLGIAVEEVACPHSRLVARQCEGLAQVAVVRLAPAGHPTCEIARTKAHSLNSRSRNPGQWNDRLNIGPAGQESYRMILSADPISQPCRPPAAAATGCAARCFRSWFSAWPAPQPSAHRWSAPRPRDRKRSSHRGSFAENPCRPCPW